MSSGSTYDVIVIGGGPSGMMAAGRAASRGLKVVLIEKNKVLGKKLSITGGGRCNILNAEADQRTLLAHYGDAAKFLHSPFAQHGMQDSWDFFEERGVPLVVEARKRAFPQSQQAVDVTACMRRYVIEQNVELKLGVKVQEIIAADGVVESVVTNKGTFTGKKVVIATGGAAREDTGSTGDGFGWLQALGHRVALPNPNIVPLTVQEPWVHALSGTSLSFMKITFGTNKDKKQRFSKTGKILFTHFGLSGPLILNSAYEVKQLLKDGQVQAEIDMYPDTDLGTVRNRVLEIFHTNQNKQLKNIMKSIAPAGLGAAVLAQLPPTMSEAPLHSITKEERTLLADTLKGMKLTIDGTKGMEWAVVSDGGVDLKEVDTKTMTSKLYNNLHLTGDVLNINRPSGGYSLQLCWTTGWVAGSHV